MRKSTRIKEKGIIIGIFVVTLVFSIIGVSDSQDWGDDFSQYIAQARAIATNTVPEWFQKNKFIINNSPEGLGSAAYPWLFPIMITPIYQIWGLNYIPYKVFLGLVFAIVVVLYYVFLRRRKIPVVCSIVFCLLISLNREFTNLTRMIMSDLPSLALCFLAWIVIDWYIQERTFGKALLVGTACFLAVFTRTMNLAVIAALAIVDFIDIILKIGDARRNKSYFHFRNELYLVVPYMTFSAFWIITGLVLPKGGSSYFEYFTFDSDIIANHIRYYLALFWEFIFQGELEANMLLKTCIMLVLFPFVCISTIGIIRGIVRKDHLSLYIIIMLVMLCLYNHRQGTRFAISLFPIILYYLYEGAMSVLYTQSKRKIFALCGIAVALFCLGLEGNRMINSYSFPKGNQVSNDQAIQAYDYINKEICKEDVVYFEKPRALYLYTGVNSYVDWINYDLSRADYVLRNKILSGNTVDQTIANNPEQFEEVFSNDVFCLYRIVLDK